MCYLFTRISLEIHWSKQQIQKVSFGVNTTSTDLSSPSFCSVRAFLSSLPLLPEHPCISCGDIRTNVMGLSSSGWPACLFLYKTLPGLCCLQRSRIGPFSSHEDQGSGSRDNTLSFQAASLPTKQ